MLQDDVLFQKCLRQKDGHRLFVPVEELSPVWIGNVLSESMSLDTKHVPLLKKCDGFKDCPTAFTAPTTVSGAVKAVGNRVPLPPGGRLPCRTRKYAS